MDERIVLVVDPSFEACELHREIVELKQTVAKLVARQEWLETAVKGVVLSANDVRQRAIKAGLGR